MTSIISKDQLVTDLYRRCIRSFSHSSYIKQFHYAFAFLLIFVTFLWSSSVSFFFDVNRLVNATLNWTRLLTAWTPSESRWASASKRILANIGSCFCWSRFLFFETWLLLSVPSCFLIPRIRKKYDINWFESVYVHSVSVETKYMKHRFYTAKDQRKQLITHRTQSLINLLLWG